MDNKKRKILLVEDDPFFIDLYSAKLKKGGFDVAVADDEREGFEKAITEKPEVILLDISLPEHEDFWLLKKIKDNKKTKDVPVMVLSDLTNDSEIAKAFSFGACDYLVRSQIVFREVINKINSNIKKEDKKD